MHITAFFTKPLAAVETTAPPDPLARERRRYEELHTELAAAVQELDAAKRDEAKYRSTHFGHEKIINGGFYCSLNAMQEDKNNPQIQRRVRRSRAANEVFQALLAENKELKNLLGLARY